MARNYRRTLFDDAVKAAQEQRGSRDLYARLDAGADGFLTWRQINEPYLVEAPDYDLGDPKSCAIGVDAFDSK